MRPEFLCRHKREIAATVKGKRGLRCLDCGRMRFHPWAATAKEERRWRQKFSQTGDVVSISGKERRS